MRTEVSNVDELPAMHRMGHTCANLNGDLLFVWGGTNEAVAYASAPNPDLWIYETLTGYWRHRTCLGECPPYLSSSSSALIGQKMFVFGGHSTAQDNWLNCLYCLDLDTFVWRDLGSSACAKPTKPIRSDKNVAWSYENKLYIFGGYGWSQVEHYLELLDCQRDLQLTPDFRWPKFGWNNQLVEYNPADRTWRWPSYKGKCPSARAAHSGALMGDKYFVFGGRDSHERLNDLYTFDMRTLEWKQIAVLSSAPELGSDDLLLPQHRHLRGAHHHHHQLQSSRQRNGRRPRPRPLAHLLDGDANSGADEAIAPNNAHQNEDQNFGQDDDDHNDLAAEENHRQLVEEMHDVQVEDDEDWVPVASSSGGELVVAGGASVVRPTAPEPEENGGHQHEEEEEDYFHPFHMLERWSLSSGGANQTSRTDGGGSENNDSDCLHDEQRRQGQAVQNLMPVNNLDDDGSGGGGEMGEFERQPLTRQQDVSRSASQDRPNSLEPQQGLVGEELRIGGGPLSGGRADIEERNGDNNNEGANAGRVDNENRRQNNSAADNNDSGDDDFYDGLDDGAQHADDTINRLTQSLPTGRSFCSLTPISSDSVLLFGGVDSNDRNLDDCWLFNVNTRQWSQIVDFKHKRSRLWHTGAKTKQNEVVIMGGSSSEKIDEFCSDVFIISFEAKSLKRLALDAVSRSVRMKTIQRTRGLPSTLMKLIKLRKQAMALTMRRSASQRLLPAAGGGGVT